MIKAMAVLVMAAGCTGGEADEELPMGFLDARVPDVRLRAECESWPGTYPGGCDEPCISEAKLGLNNIKSCWIVGPTTGNKVLCPTRQVVIANPSPTGVGCCTGAPTTDGHAFLWIACSSPP